MNIQKLVLRNFRNYHDLQVQFSKGLNVLVGDNGSGKTNIVEAIYFLSLARSFRTMQIDDLIKKGAQFATIEGWLNESTINRHIVAVLTSEGKQITCNDKKVVSISKDLSKLANVIVFQPKDSLMFDGLPAIRREYLDLNLSKKSENYLESLIIYSKLLKERNLLLKEENPNETQLEVITSQLVDVSLEIDRYRQIYVTEVNAVLTKIVSSIIGDYEKVVIKYEPMFEINKFYKEKLLDLYKKNLSSDIKHKMTQIGVHREDFVCEFNGRDIVEHGSQGEKRLCAIALKLAPYFLIEDKDKRPIVVLDDILSELDDDHQNLLINFVKKMEQVFITTTKIKNVNASIYDVRNHEIYRRNA